MGLVSDFKIKGSFYQTVEGTFECFMNGFKTWLKFN